MSTPAAQPVEFRYSGALLTSTGVAEFHILRPAAATHPQPYEVTITLPGEGAPVRWELRGDTFAAAMEAVVNGLEELD